MYVCVCKAVTDRRIREAVSEGACSLRDLTRTLGVGTGCGKCVPMAQSVLTETLLERGPTLVRPVQTPRAA